MSRTPEEELGRVVDPESLESQATKDRKELLKDTEHLLHLRQEGREAQQYRSEVPQHDVHVPVHPDTVDPVSAVAFAAGLGAAAYDRWRKDQTDAEPQRDQADPQKQFNAAAEKTGSYIGGPPLEEAIRRQEVPQQQPDLATAEQHKQANEQNVLEARSAPHDARGNEATPTPAAPEKPAEAIIGGPQLESQILGERHKGERDAMNQDHEQRRAEESAAMEKIAASHNERHANDAPEARDAANAKFGAAQAERQESFEKKLAAERADLDQRQAAERARYETYSGPPPPTAPPLER